jgi:hypothetical protein
VGKRKRKRKKKRNLTMHMEETVFMEEKMDAGTLRDKGHRWVRLHRKKLDMALHDQLAETESVIRLDKKLVAKILAL